MRAKKRGKTESTFRQLCRNGRCGESINVYYRKHQYTKHAGIYFCETRWELGGGLRMDLCP